MKLLRVLWLFIVDLALMSYECEAPETQFEKERRKSLRLVNRLGLYTVVFIYSQIFSSFELKLKYCLTCCCCCFFFFWGGGGLLFGGFFFFFLKKVKNVFT